jgi:hypothetical protein
MHLSLRENASKAKNHATAVLGETLGTAMFLFIVCFTSIPILAPSVLLHSWIVD